MCIFCKCVFISYVYIREVGRVPLRKAYKENKRAKTISAHLLIYSFLFFALSLEFGLDLEVGLKLTLGLELGLELELGLRLGLGLE